MNQLSWKEKDLNPLRIRLDPQNPRIEVPDGAKQGDIRKKLLERGEVIPLANSIIDFGGLLPGERVIVCKEGDRFTVLEGNRRVCACQIILDRNLLPQNLKRRLRPVTSDVTSNIAKIRTEIAPTRDDAEPVITKRHTEPGVLQWNTSAKMRRASRLLEEGYGPDEIAEKLSASKATIRQAIREYRLYRYAINIGQWTEKELETLTDEGVKTNPFTRFFNVGGVKEKLGLFFDENDHPKTKIDQKVFDKLVMHIARSFLIPVSTNDNKPIANTRTSSDTIFAAFDPDKNVTHDLPRTSDEAERIPEPQSYSRSEKPRRSKPKAATASFFFENLTCSIQDERLVGITKEIVRIDITKMPIAASMLLRALLESALDYQIRYVKKLGELHKQIRERNKGRPKDVGLTDLIRFCSDKKNEVFISPRAAEALHHSAVSIYKEQLDIIIHGKWAEASQDVLLKSATALRPIINYILEGHQYEFEE